MRPLRRRHALLAGGLLAVLVAAVLWWGRPGSDPAAAVAVRSQAAGGVSQAADAPLPPDRPAPPESLGPDPKQVARPSIADLPANLGSKAAEDYRRRARYPEWSHPLAPGEGDPIARDREISPVASRGRNGEEPTLSVWPSQLGYEAPEPVVLLAALTVQGRPVDALSLRGTLLTEDLQPLYDFAYVDDGTDGDWVAGDGVRTAMIVLPRDLTPELSASYLVQVRALTETEEERLAATSFQYSSPHSRLTGRFRDRVVDGSLVIDAEVDVQRAGRFHLEATLYSGDATQGIGLAQSAGWLGTGLHWMSLSFYGVMFHDRAIDGPYLVRRIALSTTTSMPNAKNRVIENAYLTRGYSVSDFTDASFADPSLLDAARRIEQDEMPRELEAEG